MHVSKSRVTTFHFTFIYKKNLTTKITQLIAFLQGKQFVQPKRTDSRENSTSIFVSNPICQSAPEWKNPVTIPEEVLYGFRFTIPNKAIIAIFNTHFH